MDHKKLRLVENAGQGLKNRRTTCESCGGKMQKIFAIHDGDSIRRYLLHFGLDPDHPLRTILVQKLRRHGTLVQNCWVHYMKPDFKR